MPPLRIVLPPLNKNPGYVAAEATPSCDAKSRFDTDNVNICETSSLVKKLLFQKVIRILARDGNKGWT